MGLALQHGAGADGIGCLGRSAPESGEMPDVYVVYVACGVCVDDIGG